MAKYIIDIPDEAVEFMGGRINVFVEPEYKVGDCKHYALRIPKEDIEPYTEPDRKAIDLQYARDIENVARMNYNEGAKDAWDFARSINYLGYDDFVSCFGGKTEEQVYELSYSEVKAKYDAWKKRKEEIRVGDVVVYADDPNKEKAIVLRLYQPKQYKTLADILCEDGTVVKMVVAENLAWTGRHFDEVAELLKKMRDADED